MKDAALVFGDEGVSVDWSSTVTGIHNVKQKLINNMMTDAGTDEVVPSRGTSLLRSVTGGGVFDLRSAQHALNFAALSAKRTVRDHERSDYPESDRVADFSALLKGVVDLRVLTQLAITTRDGNSIGNLQQII
jgi:hypothetical protein